MRIRDMNFGKSDGYTESMEPNFSELFYDKEGLYGSLVKGNKYLIMGRKGTGKTTLAAYYCHNNNDKKQVSKQLFSNDYIQKKLDNFAENEINSQENSLFWEYIYLLDIGEQISEFFDSLNWYNIKRFLYKGDVSELKSLIKKEHYKIDGIVTEYNVQIDSNMDVRIGSKIGSGIAKRRSLIEKESISKKREKYYETLPQLKKVIFNLIKRMDLKITIFYDDMDQLEESMELTAFKRLIKNMVYTADKLNKEFCKFTTSRVCLVIREDIIDMLHHEANNLNKQISDCGIKIDWFLSEYTSSNPLVRMVLHKIKKSGNEFEYFTPDEIYSEVFDKGVPKYLIERSFGRPRDIIMFLNIYKDNFPNEVKITIDNLMRVEQDYSKWFYDELLNEIAISENKENIKLVLNYISNRGYSQFTYQKLSDYISREDNEPIDNLLDILTVMRDYGIIGVVNKNKKIDFTYRKGLSTNINKNTKFILHRGLYKYLNMS